MVLASSSLEDWPLSLSVTRPKWVQAFALRLAPSPHRVLHPLDYSKPDARGATWLTVHSMANSFQSASQTTISLTHQRSQRRAGGTAAVRHDGEVGMRPTGGERSNGRDAAMESRDRTGPLTGSGDRCGAESVFCVCRQDGAAGKAGHDWSPLWRLEVGCLAAAPDGGPLPRKSTHCIPVHSSPRFLFHTTLR